MAKKKVNIEIPRSGAAAEVPSGDVNIVYNDVRIAGLSETVDATLKTGGSVVPHDIVVEYNKPEAPVLPPNNVAVEIRNQATLTNYRIRGSLCQEYNNQIYYVDDIAPDALITVLRGFIGFTKIGDNVIYGLVLEITDNDHSSAEALTMTPSIGTVTYDGSGTYVWQVMFMDYPVLPDNISITITDKTT